MNALKGPGDASGRRAARVAGVVAMALGGTVLLGWCLDIELLKSVVPGYVSMKANTALAFVLAGASLCIHVGSTSIPALRRAAVTCASMVAGIGGLTLIEHVGVNLHIDELLFRTTREVHTVMPGRMAPNTALAFAMTGSALILVDAKGRAARLSSQILTLGILFIGFFALTGYTFGASQLYGVTGFTSMAVHTAAGLVALSAGTLFARPERGVAAILIQDTPAGLVARRLVPLSLVLPLAVGALSFQGQIAGFYGPAVGLALVTITCSSLLVTVVLWHGMLDGRMDRAREQALGDERFLVDLGALLQLSADASTMLGEVSQRFCTYVGASRCFVREIEATSVHAHDERASASDDVLRATSDERAKAFMAREGIAAHIAVPLSRRGEWVATFVVEQAQARDWEPREVSLARRVGEEAWLRLEALRALQAIRQGDARKAAILNSALDAIVWMNERGRIVEFNPAAERMFMCPRSAALGKPMLETLIVTASLSGQDDDLARYFERPDSPVLGRLIERQATRADRSAFPVEVVLTAVPGETPPLFTAFFRDITQRQQAATALKLTEERCRTLIATAQNMTWTTDSKGSFAEPQTSWEAFTGQSWSQHQGGGWIDAIHPEDRADVLRAWNQAVETRTPYRSAHRVRTPSGEHRYLVARAAPLLDARGEVLEWLAIGIDITPQVQIEEALRRSEERFTLAVRGSNDGIWDWDILDGHDFFSDRWSELLGFAPGDLTDHVSTLESLLHPQDRTMAFAALEAHLRDRAVYDVAYRMKTAKGEYRWYRARGQAVWDTDGTATRMAGSLTDITESKHAEQERAHLVAQLAALNSDLEIRVRARTNELAQALKEREVLLQEIHHRVKNNLQVISSLISMQARQVTDSSTRAALDECRARVQTITLIHEALYQSKDCASVPFSDYARNLAENVFCALRTSPSSIVLRLQLDPCTLAVAKAIPCGLLLNELITNALKHAFPERRHGCVQVELREHAGEVALSVADDGVGLPADFELGPGGSLGMQLILTLIEQIDGHLEVSRAGGTKFSVTFSSARAAAAVASFIPARNTV